MNIALSNHGDKPSRMNPDLTDNESRLCLFLAMRTLLKTEHAKELAFSNCFMQFQSVYKKGCGLKCFDSDLLVYSS